jgi:hypothetical protein
MHWKPKGWTLIGMLLLAVPGAMTVMKVAAAQATSPSTIDTTQVTDTVYRGDGTLANGSVIVSWQAFTAASGQSVPTGSTSATITNGAMSLALVPNAGSTPIGTYYTAVYHLDDGSVSREFWVVPVSLAPVQVSTIKSTVLPTSVAMQTVSKNYVDTAIAAAVTGHPLDSSNPFVEKAGDTMTGPLVLPADPTTPNQAADKHYVDVSVAGVAAGLGQKVSTVPAATQVVVQPVGTQLQVNNLNGDEYASQYSSGLGGKRDCECGDEPGLRERLQRKGGPQLSGGRELCGDHVEQRRGWDSSRGRKKRTASRHVHESDRCEGGWGRCRPSDRCDFDSELAG